MSWRIDKFLYQKEKPLWMKGLLFPLYLFSLLYGWTIRTINLFYSLGLLKSKALPCPVICVGNITVGGTGKTPLVMALAKRLSEKGIPLAILSRGYKRKKTSMSLVSDGQTILLSPEESGDESYLMANVLRGIPVLVGRHRFVNGQRALKRFGVRGILLDDGYQHLQLHRDLNILLVDSQIGFGDHHLLPRGILREPIEHLRRAHLILLTKVENLEACQPLEKKIQQIHPTVPIFHSHYQPLGLINPKGEWEGLDSMKGKKALALTGIVNADYFVLLLRKCGVKIVNEAIFPDHHLYHLKDLISIEEKTREVDWIVTTEKDLINLEKLNLHHFSIRALRIEMKIWEEEDFYKRVMEIF